MPGPTSTSTSRDSGCAHGFRGGVISRRVGAISRKLMSGPTSTASEVWLNTVICDFEEYGLSEQGYALEDRFY
jgi:hypothetical protein